MTTPGWADGLVHGRDPVGSWPAPGPPRSGWQLATITDVIPETPDTVTLRVSRTGDEAFLPGQHFHLEIPTGAQFPAVETYSAGSSPWPDPRVVDFTIKEIPGGRVSPLLVRKAPVGATLRIEGPLGYFTWTEADGGPLVLVGAGSGIVPLMAIVRYAAAKDLEVPTRLLYSSRDQSRSIYYHELERLADRHRWLEVAHTFTADRTDPAARYHRRIDAEMLADAFADTAGTCLAYLCGPSEMVRVAEVGLMRAGVVPGRLLSEEWD